MEIAEVDDTKIVEMKDDPLFIGGKVSIQALAGVVGEPGTFMVHFTPGARTRMHTHTGSQYLFVTKGKGVVGTPEKKREVSPGTLVYFPPLEPHFHGAGESEPFTHLSIGGGNMKLVD